MAVVWWHRSALALAGLTLLLIAVSGMMVSESTGLQVPDWARVGQPLHRALAGLVTLAAVGALVLSYRAGSSGTASAAGAMAAGRILAWTALAVVLAQAGLGMALAGGKLASIGVLQAMFSHGLFAVGALLVALTKPNTERELETVEDELRPSLRSVAWVPAVLVVVQMVLGSAYRHGLMGMIPHLLGAFVIAGGVAFLGLLVVTTYPKHPVLKGISVAMIWLMLAQIVLGLLALMYRANFGGGAMDPNLVLFTVAHIVVGSLTLAASVVLAVQIRRYVREAAVAPAASESRREISGEPQGKAL